MRYIKLYENYSKRRMVPLEDKKILSDMSDIFVELTDKGFVRNTFIGVIGQSKLREHKTDTLYLCIAKPTGKTLSGLFDTYFDDTLQLFKQDEVKEYVLMFIDYMKVVWGKDIEVDLPNTNTIDKYYVRIKKET